MLTKSICLEISAPLGETLPKATPWTVFYIVGGMDLSLSSWFLSQWVRCLILYEIKSKNPCRRQFGSTLAPLHQGGQCLAFEHFSQPQEQGRRKMGSRWRQKTVLGWSAMFSWALFNPFSLLTYLYPKLWGCSYSWQGRQRCNELGMLLSLAASSFDWPKSSYFRRGNGLHVPSNNTQVRFVHHGELS